MCAYVCLFILILPSMLDKKSPLLSTTHFCFILWSLQRHPQLCVVQQGPSQMKQRAIHPIQLILCGLVTDEGQKSICALTSLLWHQVVLAWDRELGQTEFKSILSKSSQTSCVWI